MTWHLQIGKIHAMGAKDGCCTSGTKTVYCEIGKLKEQLDWLNNVWVQPVLIRRGWIDSGD